MSEAKKPYRIDGRPQTIYRVVKSAENPYVMIDRRPIDNPTLSFKAKGILTYLMSRPDGWEVSIPDLISHAKDGEDGVRAGMKELKDAGHVKYTCSREQGRITGWLIEVFEVPHREKPDVVLPDVENPTQVLSTLSSTELKERYSKFAKKIMELQGGAMNAIDGELVSVWIEKHADKWIDLAIDTARGNGAKSAKYADKILIGWEADGYPKTREQQIAERKQPAPVKEERRPKVRFVDGVAVLG